MKSACLIFRRLRFAVKSASQIFPEPTIDREKCLSEFPETTIDHESEALAPERASREPRLKAGGFGLNLTAAGYVFLLDPWWNPAVEAQAIDRAHRIGQTQPVFAYRMIARDTVEEKMLELQRSKRHLADAVLEGDGTSLKELTAEDLRALLS